MAQGTDVRTVADLDRAVRALCEYFKTDTTIIIGSQAILVGWSDASAIMRTIVPNPAKCGSISAKLKLNKLA